MGTSLPSLRSIAIIAVLALALAGCGGADNISMLHPHGLVADAQRRWLIDINLVMAIVVVPVFVLVPLFAWRYRRRNDKATYRRLHQRCRKIRSTEDMRKPRRSMRGSYQLLAART